MKAFARDSYGGPEVLRLKNVEKPVPGEEEILVKVIANSANPADWHILRGKPFFARFTFGLFRPKFKIPGSDFAGIVMETGKNVKRFKAGDRVFGETLRGGAFAEYISIPEANCATMPDHAGFAEMAGVPVAGLTALQAIVTHGRLKKGERVLINGASGGVGHFAVQIATAYGADVTAVCSSRNIDFARSLGANHVIAYDRENIHEHRGKYHLVIDTNGNLFHSDFTRLGERGVLVGFTTMGHMAGVLIRNAIRRFPLAQFTAHANTADLQILAGLVEEGKIRTRIERSYSYQEIPAAIGFVEAMRTRGKVVMIWE